MNTYMKLIILFIIDFLVSFVLFYFVINSALDYNLFSLRQSVLLAALMGITTLVFIRYKKVFDQRR